MITEEKCFDKLLQLFKVVSMIKKSQLITLKGAKENAPKALVFGEFLLQ